MESMWPEDIRDDVETALWKLEFFYLNPHLPPEDKGDVPTILQELSPHGVLFLYVLIRRATEELREEELEVNEESVLRRAAVLAPQF